MCDGWLLPISLSQIRAVMNRALLPCIFFSFSASLLPPQVSGCKCSVSVEVTFRSHSRGGKWRKQPGDSSYLLDLLEEGMKLAVLVILPTNKFMLFRCRQVSLDSLRFS